MPRRRVYFMYPSDWDHRKPFLNLSFPMSEYDRRLRATRAALARDGLDAALVYGDIRQYGYVQYLTNFYPQLGQSMAIVTQDGEPVLVTTAAAHGEPMHSFVPQACWRDVRTGLHHSLPVHEPYPSLLSLLCDVIRERKLTEGRIGLVGRPLLTYDLLAGLMARFPSAHWSDWGRAFDLVRAVKSDLELQAFEEGARAVDASFEAALRAAKPGVTELEIAGVLEFEMRKHGVETVSNIFDTRVCSGPRSFLKNATPTDRKLVRGDSLYFDISAQHRGCCLDVSTSHVVDAEPTPGQRALFEAAAEMTEALLEAAKPGTRARELVETIRAVAVGHGMGSIFCEYIVGHGMGAAQVEIPHFDPDSDDVLDVGMVFATEPMVVDPVIGTGCIERIAVVDEKGGRLISQLPLRPWAQPW